MTDHQHKPAKKAAKKAPAKKAPHSPEKDARRAFEHLGRVNVLLHGSAHKSEPLPTLLNLATRIFQAKQYKHAAELLRASEHIAFAGLLQNDTEKVSPELHREIEHEIEHQGKKAAEHADPETMDESIRRVFESASQNARECFKAGAYRASLEYARAAEALTHIDELGAMALPGAASKRLES